MVFFKWYGKWHRKMLSRFDHLFVQTSESKKLVDEIGLADICSVSGDTRFDRVIEIALQVDPILKIESFIENSKVIVAGSTWPEDEEVLKKSLSALNNQNLKLIIAPHEINEKHLTFVESLFPNSVRFSKFQTSNIGHRWNCLIIDNVGMLSQLYKYAYITYIGGGLKNKGVHNVLEAAVFNKPVLFGPFYHKYMEAIGLLQTGGGLTFTDENRNGVMLVELINALLINEEEYKYRCEASGNYVQINKGATQKIIQFIQENRLLTSRSKC